MASTLAGLQFAEPVKPGGPQPTEKPESKTGGLAGLKFEPGPSVQIDLTKGEDPFKEDGDDAAFLQEVEQSGGFDEADDDAFLEEIEQSSLRNSLVGINIGMAEMFDAPFELSAWILRQIPGLEGVRGNPMATLFGATGSIPEEGTFDTESSAFQIGKVVGNSIAALPLAPLGAGIQPAAQTAKAVGLGATVKGGARAVGKAIGETAVKAPVTFAASEIAAATGAGAGLDFTRKNFPDSPTTQFLGAMLGGVAPALMPTRLVIKSGITIRSMFKNVAQKGKVKAAEEIQKAVIDLESASARIKNPDLLDDAAATAAQKTGDPGLMALERSIRNRSHKTLHEADEQIQRMADGIDDSLKASDEAIETTRATLQGQKDYTKNLVDANLKMAARNADEAIGKLGPSGTAEQANAIARREIEAVEELARVDERFLWDAVPRDVTVKASASTQVMRELFLKEFRSRTFKGRKNLPSDLDLEKFLGTFKTGKKKQKFFVGGALTKKASMGELQDLRSDVLREIRKQRSELAPNNQTIKILDDLQEALLLDMGAMTGGKGTAEGDSLRLALDYSRNLNQTFNRGIMAKLKGVDKLGTVAIPEELTLVSAFSGKPEKAAENLRAIIRASKGVEGKTPPSPDMLGAMEDFIKTDFQKKVIRGGKINSFKAQQYLERNLKILDEFPEVRDDISRAIKTEDVRAIRQRRSEAFSANPPVAKMSKATLFIEKTPRKMFESLEATRPEQFNAEVNNLLNKVNKDTTGEALEGLQDSFFDWIRTRAKGSGGEMDKLLNTSKIAAIMGKILDKGQIERLRKITNSMKVVDTARSVKALDSAILEKGESKMLTTIMRIAGAKTGAGISAKTGGGAGGLQSAAIMSERFKAVASKLNLTDPAAKLLIDAFEDDSGELLKMLLTEITSAKQLKEVNSKLNAWAAGVAYQTGDRSLAENTEEK